MMGRQKERIAAGIMCLILLLPAGCAGETGEKEGQKDAGSEVRTEDTSEQKQTESKEQKQTESKEQKQLIQAARPQFILSGIRSVSLTKEGEEFLRISREPAEYKMSFDYWEVLNPYDENATVDTEAMYELFEALCSLEFEAPVQIEEGCDTGIGDSDMGFTVEYVDTADEELARDTDEADTAAEVILGKEDGNGGRYAAVGGNGEQGNEEQVYVLPENVLQAVYGREPFDYILKIPVLISADTLKEVVITAGNEQYEIQVDTASDSYKFGKKEVEKEEFASLYQAISGVMLTSGITGTRSEKKEEPELIVSFHRNMPDAPDVQVSYVSYDDEFDSVEINGKEWFLVRKEDVEALTEQIKKAF